MKKVAAQRLKHQIIDQADVICTTIDGLVSSDFEDFFVKKISLDPTGHRPFSCCFIDDASHCTEPETLMPLKFAINKLVLAGDLEQTSFSVKSPVSHLKIIITMSYLRNMLYILTVSIYIG